MASSNAAACLFLSIFVLFHAFGHSDPLDYSNLLDEQNFENSKGQAALSKLRTFFGIDAIPPNESSRRLEPPQYMLDIYNSVTDTSGITVARNLYGANIIRSLPDKDFSHRMHFVFNLSCVQATEEILQAEFHIYKTTLRGPFRHHEDPRTHQLEVRVYQVMDEGLDEKESGNRMLEARRVSSYSVGWEVFRVQSAVNDWLLDPTTNHGLLVTFRSGSPAAHPSSDEDEGLLKISKHGRHRYGNKRSILVLFADDGRPRHEAVFPTSDELAEWNNNVVNRRRKRAANSNETILHEDECINASSVVECTRHDLNVDFESMDLFQTFIFPKSYNAFQCRGDCSTYQIGDHVNRLTKHAIVQSLVHQLRPNETQAPCCVPNKYFSLSLLYFDSEWNVIYNEWENMVVASCGCR